MAANSELTLRTADGTDIVDVTMAHEGDAMLLVRTAAAIVILAAAASPTIAGPWEEAAAEKLKQSLYPIALSTRWLEDGTMWVYVEDNGQGREGLAMAACGALNMYEGAPDGAVISLRIGDVKTVQPEGGAHQLGYITCKIGK